MIFNRLRIKEPTISVSLPLEPSQKKIVYINLLFCLTLPVHQPSILFNTPLNWLLGPFELLYLCSKFSFTKFTKMHPDVASELQFECRVLSIPGYSQE